MVCYSFPVGLFHSLLHAGLSRRSLCFLCSSAFQRSWVSIFDHQRCWFDFGCGSGGLLLLLPSRPFLMVRFGFSSLSAVSGFLFLSSVSPVPLRFKGVGFGCGFLFLPSLSSVPLRWRPWCCLSNH